MTERKAPRRRFVSDPFFSRTGLRTLVCVACFWDCASHQQTTGGAQSRIAPTSRNHTQRRHYCHCSPTSMHRAPSTRNNVNKHVQNILEKQMNTNVFFYQKSQHTVKFFFKLSNFKIYFQIYENENSAEMLHVVCLFTIFSICSFKGLHLLYVLRSCKNTYTI